LLPVTLLELVGSEQRSMIYPHEADDFLNWKALWKIAFSHSGQHEYDNLARQGVWYSTLSWGSNQESLGAGFVQFDAWHSSKHSLHINFYPNLRYIVTAESSFAVTVFHHIWSRFYRHGINCSALAHFKVCPTSSRCPYIGK
jgi:hypothetical protein